ncbi:hypothetical protein MRB53_020022 [Persea americana]|uniref:Uncharacterized protein n=1 Tax=Persea americana TaxID=3435 RepID=A0ACC2KZU9_PERAE|nr:hypothetical protein MRB53_020022 [Persea americana]
MTLAPRCCQSTPRGAAATRRCLDRRVILSNKTAQMLSTEEAECRSAISPIVELLGRGAAERSLVIVAPPPSDAPPSPAATSPGTERNLATKVPSPAGASPSTAAITVLPHLQQPLPLPLHSSL